MATIILLKTIIISKLADISRTVARVAFPHRGNCLADTRPERRTTMLQLRTWGALGGGNRDWLKAKHHFAIDSQGNPAHTRLGSLVVWNDDEIAPHGGFPMHAHRDMEIVTYVREGVLHHQDNAGGRGEIRAGNVQALSAGRGIRHSEHNGGNTPLRLFQIWLLPRRRGIDPHWATRSFAEAHRA